MSKPRIMFIVPTTFGALVRKGVEYMIRERDEGGYFERVVTVHPLAPADRVIDLTKVHLICEFGWPALSHLPQLLRWLGAPLHLLRVMNRLRMLVQEERIDMIRATDPYWMGLLAWAVSSKLRGPSYCVSIHADYDKCFQLDGSAGAPTVFGSRKLATLLERFVLSHSPMVMPIRDSLGQYALAKGAKLETIRVIPHGIDLSPFRRQPSVAILDHLGLKRDKNIISFTGRLSRENYVDDVLDLARRLAAKRDDIDIVMAGGGREEERLRHLISEDETLAKVLHLVGFQSRDVVVSLRMVSAVNLCLMGGFSLIEACASGRPVIAYDVGWHGELIRDGETGRLLNEGDLDALEEATVFLLDHETEAVRLGNAARALAFERHDRESTSVIKQKWYRELLASTEETH